ncbi:hypothetical protein B0H19DRAFT_432985 [Mycena capillaripes]|nr:hypothetical protein B0H19DRAFT_432985 [Mycena capillaripes]
MDEKSMRTHIRDFPPEVLAKILRWLAYHDLVRATRVCRLLRGVTQTYPELDELLFKRTCRFIEEDLSAPSTLGDPVMVHPALQIASYSMGEPLETIAIHHVSLDPNDANCLRQRRYFLMDLEMRHDFATRPTVTQMRK